MVDIPGSDFPARLCVNRIMEWDFWLYSDKSKTKYSYKTSSHYKLVNVDLEKSNSKRL